MVNMLIKTCFVQSVLLVIPAIHPGKMQLQVCCVGLVGNNLSNPLTDVSRHREQISATTGAKFFPNVELFIQVTVWSQMEKFCTRNLF